MFGSPDTVDSITASLRKTVDRLKALSAKRVESAKYNAALATEYSTASLSHQKEADKANRVADKIGDLLGAE